MLTALGRLPGFDRGPSTGRFRRVSLIPKRPDEGRLTEPTTAVQPWRREPLFVVMVPDVRDGVAAVVDPCAVCSCRARFHQGQHGVGYPSSPGQMIVYRAMQGFCGGAITPTVWPVVYTKFRGQATVIVIIS